MNILFVHYEHNSSACIFKDGEIISHFKEERFLRSKGDSIPFISIKKCIENFNEEITYIISPEYNITFDYIIKFISSFTKYLKVIIVLILH